MKMITRVSSTAFVAALLCFGACKSKEDKGAAGRPEANPKVSAAAPSKGTTHVQYKTDHCVFDFDAPVGLKDRGDSTGASFAFESDALTLEGWDDRELNEKPHHMYDGSEGYSDLYRGTTNGVQLVILLNAKGEPKNAVDGEGGEPKSDKEFGCTFSCRGARDRQEEVVSLCKSVRISRK